MMELKISFLAWDASPPCCKKHCIPMNDVIHKEQDKSKKDSIALRVSTQYTQSIASQSCVKNKPPRVLFFTEYSAKKTDASHECLFQKRRELF